MSIQFVQGQPYFTAINIPPKQYPYLTEDLHTDVIIIGGGVTGAILAYYFSKEGIRTTVLEKNRIAHGSTSITTALLQYELDGNARDLQQHTTLEKVLQSYDLGLKALKEINTFINEHGNHCLYKVRDTLLYTSKDTDIALLKDEFDIRQQHGLNVSFIDEQQSKYPFLFKAGVYAHEGGAELDPYLYAHQLLNVACESGAKVFENSPVMNIHYTDNGVDVTTKYDHHVKGKIVILATGYDTRHFSTRQFGHKSTTFNIVTTPLPPDMLWYNEVLIRNNKDIYNYLRTTDDHRIIIGGEDVDFVPDIMNQKLAMERYDILECKLKEMFPHIKDIIDIQYRYCGAFDSTPDDLGFLGPDPKHDKLWYALGYGANGILFAILGGMMLSKLYKGEQDPNLKLFAPDRFN